MAQSVQAQELIAPKKLEAQTSNIQVFNTSDKNANSSNRFNPFVFDEENSTNEESEKDTISLFA